MSLQIWILGCDPQFNFLFPVFIQGVSGFIFMYDITNDSSLKNLEAWLTNIKEHLPNDKNKIPRLMVGGKLDLYKERVISRRHAKKVAKQYKFLKYIECSSKTGHNIEKIFDFLTRSIYEYEDKFNKNKQNG